jgi:phosphoglycolate phosphatase
VGAGATTEGYSLSGKTDPQIMRELLERSGVPTVTVARELNEALTSYEALYLSRLHLAQVRPLPGAKELIVRLTAGASPRPLLGILTGNLRGLIAPKLEAAGIPPACFRVIACGSDDPDRGKLPAIAAERAELHLATLLSPDEVVIVGDTPADVACARRFGAHSVAVATGDYNCEQLQASKPDHVLATLLAWDDVKVGR